LGTIWSRHPAAPWISAFSAISASDLTVGRGRRKDRVDIDVGARREYLRTAIGGRKSARDPFRVEARACPIVPKSELADGHDCRRLRENVGRHTPQHCSGASSERESYTPHSVPLRLRSEALSAAQRGRGRGPLRSNGRVRWCFVQTRFSGHEHRSPPHPPRASAGPLPLPPR
jgi:hypothetical protein